MNFLIGYGVLYIEYAHFGHLTSVLPGTISNK